MVGFDVPFTFLAAGVLGWRAQGQHRDVAIAWSSLGMGVSGLAFYLVYPAWDLQYLVDPAALPVWFPAAFLAGIVSAGIAGHWVGSRHPKAIAATGALMALYLLISAPIQVYVGSYAEYHAGAAALLPMDFIGFFTVAGAPATLGFAAAWYWITQSVPQREHAEARSSAAAA